MRILMGYRYSGIGPADSCNRAFKKLGHSIVTVGPSSDPITKHDIEEPDEVEKVNGGGIYYYDVEKIVNKWGHFDLILQVEPCIYFYRLGEVDIPNAIWEIDTLLLQSNPFIQRIGGDKYIDQLGHIFTSKYNHIPQYHESGIKHVSHLPLACDPDFHKPFDMREIYDVVFIGNTTYCERQHMFSLLKERFRCWIGSGLIGDNYSKRIRQGKIGFNHGHVGEMNMRFFELMAMGAFQVCNIVHGQELLGFEDRVHLVNYVNDVDLVNIVAEFLNDPRKRERIAQAGKEKVLAEHTYQQRAEEILRICSPA